MDPSTAKQLISNFLRLAPREAKEQALNLLNDPSVPEVTKETLREVLSEHQAIQSHDHRRDAAPLRNDAGLRGSDLASGHRSASIGADPLYSLG